MANLNVAREIPSIDTDPLSYVNPVWTEYFLSNGSMFKKSQNYLKLSMLARQLVLTKIR